MKTVPKIFDLAIRALEERDLEAVARLHVVCFPEKIESLIGPRCIADVLRTRVLGPDADTFALVAYEPKPRRLAGFVYCSAIGAQGTFAHAFINRAALKRHFLPRLPFSPGLWRFVLARVLRKFVPRGANEGDTMPLPPGACVVKMLGVDPAFRFGNGAIDIMQAAEAESRRRGATHLCGLVEHSNSAAERLYRWLGWVRTSPERRDYTVFGMQKILEAG